jgi:hypothetical protein
MGSFRKLGVTVVLSVILIVTASWGFLIHKTVHQLAVYALPKEMVPFFYQHVDYLVNNAPRPDQRRNTDSTEAPKHFIDLEMYGANAANTMPMGWADAVKMYTKDTLIKYGYVPYHVIYMKGKLTEAFKKGNKDSILFYATDLGHYIGDVNVPLHTSVNYDGQLTNQKGMHSLWESMIPELLVGDYNLYSDHKAAYLKDPAGEIWTAIRRSFKLVPEMFAKEIEVSKGFTPEQKYRTQVRYGKEQRSYTPEFVKAYAAALKTSVNEQLIHSSNLVADFWYTCWVDAGKPDLSSLANPWNAETQAKFDNEMKAFKENKLIENKLLLSKRVEIRE